MVKYLPANVGEVGSIPGSGRSPGVGNGNNTLQYTCLEKSHGEKRWAGYSPWSRKGVGHVLVTKQQQLLLGNAEGKYFPINRESYVGTLLSDN